MAELSIKIININGDIKAENTASDSVSLVYTTSYEVGDKIQIATDKSNVFLMLQLDDALGKSFVYMTSTEMEYEIPFDEKKCCYSPKIFSGELHLLALRVATAEEICCYKNLALNQNDQHENMGVYPHASANVETRGESVFAAKNAINGNTESHSHGSWPYESWGINLNPNAKMKVEFGRKVKIDKLVMYERCDFPHDNWWVNATITFSDGGKLSWKLRKTDKPQTITFPAKVVEWVEISELIKADDPSLFPALTQFEVYGTEA